jgi:AcrR family transcriptional regulator
VTGARRRTGRRPGTEDTRGRILDAARHAFGKRGFEATSVRSVAADAGVDPALVHHYFGSKQRLFVAAMQFPVDPAAVLPALIADAPPERVGERFAAFVIGLWDRPDVRPLVAGVVRSAATDPVAAGMASRLLTEGPLLALASAIDRPDAALRAVLAGSQLMGVVMARYVLGVEPIASMPAPDVAGLVGPAIQHYLTGELAAPPVDGRG